MNTGGPENSNLSDASGMERFTALMSDGGRSGKLDLLLHLLANLPRPILLLGPSGAGKTSLFRQVQSRALENWTTCYVAASGNLSLEWVCLQMLQVLHPGPNSGPEATPEAQLKSELALLAKKSGKLILLLDDAGQLMPGLLGAICQFVRLHPEIQLAFALRPEDLTHKATGDPLALADAHTIEVSVLRRDTAPPPVTPNAQPAKPQQTGLARAFFAGLKPPKGLSAKIAGPAVVTLLAAATVAGFVVQALWRAEPRPPTTAVTTPEVTPQPAAIAPQPATIVETQLEPSPSPTPAPSAAVAAQPALAERQPAPTGTAEPAAAPSSSPLAEPSPTPTASAAPAPAAETPAQSPSPSTAAAMEEKPFAAIIAALPTSRAPAYGKLLELWGAAPQKPVGDECAYAKTKALRCQNLRADWQTLKTYNRPAVLELTQGGARRYLALIGIEGDKAVIDLNGQYIKTPQADIQPHLRGEAVILWKPPSDKASIGTRERHETSSWIRDRLGVPAAAGQELIYDEQVKAKVLAFQKQRGLLADGRAGALTLLQIQLLADDPQAPKLMTPAPTSIPTPGTP